MGPDAGPINLGSLGMTQQSWVLMHDPSALGPDAQPITLES